MKSVFKIPKQKCWQCGYIMDQTRSVEIGKSPEPGDISLCWQCGALSVFNKNLTCRPPSSSENLTLSLRQDVMAAQLAIRNKNE